MMKDQRVSRLRVTEGEADQQATLCAEISTGTKT